MESTKEWIYINNKDNSIRYVLGTRGENTLFCFGINPSTATPDKLDPTIKKVENIAKHNGYDSFIMLNVYPKRDTDFEKLKKTVDDTEHIKNIEAINTIVGKQTNLNVWVAFGDYIYGRDYLATFLKDIYNKLPLKNINWFTTGVNKSGSPKHPLYQKNTAKLVAFDMAAYIKTL